ncbi:hypothetical protein D3C78_1038910 [compost metagenome]
MHALSRRLAALWVGRGGDLVIDFLGEDFVFMALDVDVTDRVSGEGTLGNVALGFTVDADVRRCWHDKLLVAINGLTRRSPPSN